MQFQKLVQQSLIWRGFYFVAILLLNVVLSRYLKAAGAGWVYFLTNLFSLAVLVGSVNIDSAFTFCTSNKTIPVAVLAWFGLLFSVVVAAVLGLFYCVYFSYFPFENLSLQDIVCYGIYYTVGILLVNQFSGLFYAQKNYKSPFGMLGVLNCILVVGILYLDKIHAPSTQVVALYFYFFALQGVLLAAYFFVQNRLLSSFLLPSMPQLKLLFGYAFISFTANVIYFLVCRIDFWFVAQYRSHDELGNYIQASKMGQMLLIVPQILASVFFPQIAEGKNNDPIKTNIFLVSRLLIQFFMVFGVLDLLFGQFIFSSVFGASFNAMNLPFLLLLPGIAALSVLTLFSAYFAGSNKLMVDVVGSSLGLLFVVAGNYLFINNYGLIAAAIISSIGYSINLCYSLYVFFKINPQYSLKDFFSWKKSDYGFLKE